MIISEKQIMELMDFVNDYCVVLSKGTPPVHVDIYNSIRRLLDSITAQQSVKLEVIE